jgi:hypothetical protein
MYCFTTSIAAFHTELELVPAVPAEVAALLVSGAVQLERCDMQLSRCNTCLLLLTSITVVHHTSCCRGRRCLMRSAQCS